MGNSQQERQRGLLSESEIARLRELLGDRTPGSVAAHSTRRRSSRLPLDLVPVRCRAEHPGGGLCWSIAYMRDVSEGGVSLVYDGYLHQNTLTTIEAQTAAKETVSFEGRVVWCRHVMGRSHEVGISAQTKVPVREMVPAEVWLLHADVTKRDQPLTGRVAIFSECALARNSVVLNLENTKLDLCPASSTGELLDLVKSDPIDALLVDSDESETSLVDLVAMVREARFGGAVILHSADPECEHVASMDPLARCSFLPKPLENATLSAMLRDVMGGDDDDGMRSSEPIVSTLRTSQGTHLIESFINSGRRIIDGIIDNSQTLDAAEAQSALKKLSAISGAYGFAILGDAVDQVLFDLAERSSVRDCLPSLRRLRSVAARLTASPDSKRAA